MKDWTVFDDDEGNVKGLALARERCVRAVTKEMQQCDKFNDFIKILKISEEAFTTFARVYLNFLC